MNRMGHLHLWATGKAAALNRLRWCWTGTAAEFRYEQLVDLLGPAVPESAKRTERGTYSLGAAWLVAYWRDQAHARYGVDIGTPVGPYFTLTGRVSFEDVRDWINRVATTPPTEWRR